MDQDSLMESQAIQSQKKGQKEQGEAKELAEDPPRFSTSPCSSFKGGAGRTGGASTYF